MSLFEQLKKQTLKRITKEEKKNLTRQKSEFYCYACKKEVVLPCITQKKDKFTLQGILALCKGRIKKASPL